MKGILSFASNNPLVHSTLCAATVSVADHANVLAVFDRCIASGVVSSKIARELSEAVVTLAKSDVLFASLKNSDAPVLQLDRGKRKRALPDEPAAPAADARAPKRVALDQPDLRAQLSEAVRAISHAFAAASLAPGQPPDPALISSLQLPLHYVFLFAVTSAPRAAERTPALQELAGIIQMLGVLTGIPIGAGPAHPPPPPPWSAYAPAAPPPAGMQDLGSAVYPCLLPGCQKTFHRLYSLRAHQRLHTVVERPFRCAHCPASFVRNHDLKRHTKLHDRKAWKCAGCAKVFSRRDAIKRHKDSRRPGGKVRGADADVLGESVCAYADIEEVEVERAPGEEEGSRRTKLWNEVAFHASPPCTVTGHENVHEEGEVEPGILEEVQQIVLRLHGLLQAYVASGLGGGPAAAAAGQTQPPQASQATLASVIARTQQAGPPPAPSAGPSRDQTVEPLSPATIPSPSLPSTLALSEEQTKLLEQAIAQAALAAQAQAEAEAALEEDEEGSDIDEDEELN
ncbi:hypothetical protein WOLCODRAFT_73950 [Wolfiporia cocos MD-104 SS10]|uniref:C2H2-type domain-containing protein n=1 Tax=Wolfiporia cocos (strain MD-104) TaxID=742152 RepID=A0A2H3JKM7_WOLCO|nr:hypothetical protein WOLCODRAFT_73950 [Wolfiporia cocos MD-104 SS10]